MDSAFVVAVDLPLGTYRGVFDWILKYQPFASWQTGDVPWQMRIVGGPGSGKTTLSSIILDILQSRHEGKIPVASIFMRSRIDKDHAIFVMQVMNNIYDQLSAQVPNSVNRREPPSDSFRVLLENTGRAFLVLDDLDQCGYQASNLLEEELSRLKDYGLRVFVTSRVTARQGQRLSYWCDACYRKSHLKEHDVTVCKTCYDEADDDSQRQEAFVVCGSCRELGLTCSKSGHEAAPLISPIHDIQLILDQTPEMDMKKFVTWVIQSEHGDLNLSLPDNDVAQADLPPLSGVGRSLIEANRGKWLIEDTVERAKGNIAWARLRLDDICKAVVIDDTGLQRDRLPRNIISLFDTGILSIEDQDETTARIGLRAILLAAGLDSEEDVPMPFFRLNSLLDHDSEAALGSRSLQKILYAAKGFLSVNIDKDDEIMLYHRDFDLYVRQDYNERLVREREKL